MLGWRAGGLGWWLWLVGGAGGLGYWVGLAGWPGSLGWWAVLEGIFNLFKVLTFF